MNKNYYKIDVQAPVQRLVVTVQDRAWIEALSHESGVLDVIEYTFPDRVTGYPKFLVEMLGNVDDCMVRLQAYLEQQINSDANGGS